jgi:hypothetical protein
MSDHRQQGHTNRACDSPRCMDLRWDTRPESFTVSVLSSLKPQGQPCLLQAFATLNCQLTSRRSYVDGLPRSLSRAALRKGSDITVLSLKWMVWPLYLAHGSTAVIIFHSIRAPRPRCDTTNGGSIKLQSSSSDLFTPIQLGPSKYFLPVSRLHAVDRFRFLPPGPRSCRLNFPPSYHHPHLVPASR